MYLSQFQEVLAKKKIKKLNENSQNKLYKKKPLDACKIREIGCTNKSGSDIIELNTQKNREIDWTR